MRDRISTSCKRAITKVIANPSADVESDLKRIQAYEQLLQTMERAEKRNKLTAVLVGIACVTLISLAQIVRMPAASITLFANARSATFTLSEPWRWENPVVGAKFIRLEAYDEVDLPASIRRVVRNGALDFAGGSLSLASLNIASDARVTLESGDGTTEFFVKDAEVEGELTIVGQVEVASGSLAEAQEWPSASLDFNLPEIVVFSAHPSGAVPARLRISGEDHIGLIGVGVQSLSFARERPSGPGNTSFELTIFGTVGLSSREPEERFHCGVEIISRSVVPRTGG